MHGATQDVLGIWARWKGGQTCGGAGCVSVWGLLHGALLRHIVGGLAHQRLLWGLGYVVWPGDVVGCMECVGVLLQGGWGIMHAVWYENDILVGIQIIVSW